MFISLLRHNAGLAEEEEYVVVHEHQQVNADKYAQVCESSQGKKKYTLMQAEAEEAPAEGGQECEKHWIHKDYEVAAQ
jgi:hypothetical protein